MNRPNKALTNFNRRMYGDTYIFIVDIQLETKKNANLYIIVV